MVDMMKKLRQIISLVLVLVMFFDYGAVSASYEPASYAVAAVAGLEELIQSTEPEEIQGEEADAVEAPDLAELPEQPEDAQPGEAPEDAQQSEDPDALLQAERVSPLTGLLNQVSRLSAPYRDDGCIHIYNYYQLSLIGTGLPVEAEDVFHGYADNREADAPEAPDWGEEPEQPAEVEEPEQPAQVEQPEQPAEAEQPEQPAQVEQPEQPAEVEEPEQPAEVEQPEQPAEVEQPEQPAEAEQPEQPAEVEQPEQPAEVEQPEQIAAPEAPALPEASQQPGEAFLTQVVGRALSRVLVRDTAAPQRAVTATLAAAVAEVTGEEAAPQELAEEDAPAELQGEAQPETDPDPMTDPAQTAAEPALPAAAGESAPDDSDTLPTDAEPAPDAVPAQDSEEPEAPAATGTSPTEPDADTDTYYNNDENNEESAPAAEPAEPEEIAEPEDGEAAPPAAAPELIDDPDVVEGPETGDLSEQPEQTPDEPQAEEPDRGSALNESKFYYYDDGELVRYTSDANYYLECDIPLPKENCWTLPEDFTGSFTGRVRPGDAERVYDPETDTVFIHNPLQLQLWASPDSEDEPVLTGDVDVNTFGTGKLVFKDGSRGDAMLSGDPGADPSDYASYNKSKNATLDSGFNAKGPMRGAPNDGRDSAGQVTMTIGTTNYILIGNRQQLDAIQLDDGGGIGSTRVKVYGPDGTYAGDADVGAGEALSNGRRGGVDTGLYYTKDGNYIVFRDIDMRVSATYDHSDDTDVDSYGTDMLWKPLSFTGTMYGYKANSSLSGELNAFLVGNSLADAAIPTDNRPEIRYVKVGVTTANTYISVDDGVHGFGFFGTIGTEKGSYIQGVRAETRLPDERSTVKNLQISHIVVDMGNVTGIRKNQSLISIVTGGLGTILGKILEPLLGGLLGNGAFANSGIGLSDLLNPNRTSSELMTAMAAGGFAGMICGEATVEGCAVDCVTVKTNVSVYESGESNGIEQPAGRQLMGKGGFVGRVTGAAVYGVASSDPNDPNYIKNAALRGAVDLVNILLMTVDELTITLGSLLNGTINVGGVEITIPGVSDLLSVIGLGDIIFLLTDNVLNLGLAVPVGYSMPELKGCTAGRVMLSADDRSSNGSGKYGVGGFAGEILGASLEDCGVLDSDYLVVDADKFAGGFAGAALDDKAANLLSGLGINIGGSKLVSQLIGCYIQDSDIVVQGGSNLGGFVGHLTGSYAVNCDVDAASRLVVESTREASKEPSNKQDYVGGFAGQIGQQSSVSAGAHTDEGQDLLAVVMNLLNNVLSSSGGLLSLDQTGLHAGVMGCQIHGAVEVKTDGSYAGGMVGEGRGMLMTSSTEENLGLLKAYYENVGTLTSPVYQYTGPQVEPRCNVVWNLVDVSAKKGYAGGICGFADAGKTADSLLGGIISIDLSMFASDEDYRHNYRFKVSDTTVRGITLDDYRNIYYALSRSDNYAECTPDGHTVGNLNTGKFQPVNTPRMSLAHYKNGYTVKASPASADAVYVGGGYGMAKGGTTEDVAIENLAAVVGSNFVGGFVGATSPGSATEASNTGLTVLGINLLQLGNLLTLFADQRTRYIRVNVTGSEEGLAVEIPESASGLFNLVDIVAGGFAGAANSVQAQDCHVWRLNHVSAPFENGTAGGFVGKSTIGGLAELADQEETLSLINLGGVGNLLDLTSLLDAVPYMVPKFDGCHVGYVNNGYVKAWCAGGFAGEFQSGFVNKDTKPTAENGYVESTVGEGDEAADCVIYTDDHQLIAECGCNVPNRAVTLHSSNCTCYCCAADRGAYRYGIPKYPWSVENLGYVYGGAYAGGWGGHVFSGALAKAGDGLSLLGTTLNLSNLLSVFDAYVPMIMYAGVKSIKTTPKDENGDPITYYKKTMLSTGEPSVNNGFAVFAAEDPTTPLAPSPEGYAGGYIGLGSGVQISYSDVTYLKTGVIIHPDYLEEIEGEEYMDPENFFYDEDTGEYKSSPLYMEYAVAGAHYAGGYIGHMDMGSSASVGDSLSLLGQGIQLTNILSALNVVVSTVEHSDVVGAPGGFDVIASPRINNPQGTYGDSIGEGVAYAGGFAGKMSGGQTQDSNVSNFEYIVGEIAAGGYVGEMEPGSLASVLGGNSSVLGQVADLSNLATLLNDFVPTVQNSQTTCVPCGGAVRAQSPSDRSSHTGTQQRGMAGGFVGHMVGAQIWGFSNNDWRSQGAMETVPDQVGAIQGGNYGSGSTAAEAYIYKDGSGTTVYKPTSTYTISVSPTQTVTLSAGSYYVKHTNGDGTTTYTPYSGGTSSLTAINRDAKQERLLLTDRNIEAVTYVYSAGINASTTSSDLAQVIYKFKEDYSNDRGTDYASVTRNTFGKNDYFTATTQTDGTVLYEKYTGSTSNFNETDATIVCVVQMTEQLTVDRYETDRNGNPERDDNGNPILITEEIPNLHEYGTVQIFLRGKSVQEPQRQCAAIRIRSVYGHEYAGGYVGLMEAGSQVDTGNASLLGKLVDVSNVLSALKVAYSTIYFGYVNGPMRGGDKITASGVSYKKVQPITATDAWKRAEATIDYHTFKIWYEYVGQYGGQNYRDMSGLANLTSAEYADLIENYLYGYNVRAGRGSNPEDHVDPPRYYYDSYSGTTLSLAGTAGGFGGSMWSGVIHDSEGLDARNVLAMRAAGGFMGEMLTKGLAELGQVNLLGGLIPLNLGSVAQIGQLLVPSVRRSGITGYQRGLTVIANGELTRSAGYDPDTGLAPLDKGLTYDEQKSLGNAGGYVGASYGGQIGLPDDEGVGDDVYYYPDHRYNQTKSNTLVGTGASIWVNNLIDVKATGMAGGFVGKSSSASLLGIDLDDTTKGPLQDLISGLISSPGQLVSGLDATIGTVKYAVVNALPSDRPTKAEKDALKQQYVDENLPLRWDKYIQEHPDEFLNGEPVDGSAQWNALRAMLTKLLEEEFEAQYEEQYINDDHGIVIGGYMGRLPKNAGGFAGYLEASVFGERNNPKDDLVVHGLRSVKATINAGGFFGFAGTGDVANVGGGQGTALLNLVQAGSVGVLDVFRPYVYYSEVNGVEDGIQVESTTRTTDGKGTLQEYDIDGAAGGFGGRMENGTILHSFVFRLNDVEADNYAGGFVGYMGRSKMVDVSNVQITNNSPIGALLSTLGLGTGLNLGAFNIIGSVVTDCGVTGYGDPTEDDQVNVGFDVKTRFLQKAVNNNGNAGVPLSAVTAACSAGFIGYGDLTQIEDSTVDRLKKVSSQQIAAGFLGRGTCASLVEANLDIALVQQLLQIVGFLVLGVLNLDEVADIDLINLDGFDYLGLKLLSDGYLLMLNLGGLRIGVNLDGRDGADKQHLLVTIGSSTIDVLVDRDGNILDTDENASAVSISLFEANRTSVTGSTVTGVLDGYDVHGAGYVEVDETHDGYDDDDSGKRNTNDSIDLAENNLGSDWGYAGGFVGYHKGSFFSHNEMLYCDVVAGSKGTQTFEDAGSYASPLKVGPFTGGYNTNSNTGSRNIDYFEGRGALGDNDNQNIYHIYRNVNAHYVNLDGRGILAGDTDAQTGYMRYNVQHRTNGISAHMDSYPTGWENWDNTAKSIYLAGYLLSDPYKIYHGVYQFSKTKPTPGTHDGALIQNLPDTYLEDAEYFVTYDQSAETGTDSDVTLDAYISDGKAKLMLGKILEENTPHEVLPVQDINDPCYEVEITVVKEWEHGSNPDPAKSVKFIITRIATTDPNRALFVNSDVGSLVWEGTMAPATTADSVDDITVTDMLVTWAKKLDAPDPDKVTSEYMPWGTASDLNKGNKNNQIFQSDETGALLLDQATGYPIPVTGDQQLYLKSKNLKKFVAGERVPLYYDSGSGYRRAWIYNTDENGELVYSDDQFDPATGTQNGDGTVTYEDTNTGDTFTLDAQANLIAYTFCVNEDEDRVVTVKFDPSTGAITEVSENGTPLQPENGVYTANSAPHEKFVLRYSKPTGILDMDYVNPRDEDIVYYRVDGVEAFGFNAEYKLVYYSLFDMEDNATAIELKLPTAGAPVGKSFSLPGTTPSGKNYVVSYDVGEQRISVYYDIPAVTLNGDGESLVYFEEEEDGDTSGVQLYGMNAAGDLVRFRYRYPDDAAEGFQVDVNPETGAITSFKSVTYSGDTATVGAEVAPNANGTYTVGSQRYTVRYDRARRTMNVNAVSNSEDDNIAYIVVNGDEQYGYDAEGNLAMYRYTTDGRTFELTLTPGTGTVTAAKEGSTALEIKDVAHDGGSEGYILWNQNGTPDDRSDDKYYFFRYDQSERRVYKIVDPADAEEMSTVSGDGDPLEDTLIVYHERKTDVTATDGTTVATEDYYYNAKGELVRYKFKGADGGVVTLDIDPAEDVVEYYTTATSTTGKRYYFKYDKASGKATMLYDLPEEYPVVFKKTEGSAEFYYNLDGELVRYRYTDPTDGGEVTLDIDPTQNVVEYYTAATSTTGKRYYFKYEKASGKATMLYDLPGEYPAVFAYSEAPSGASDPGASDVCYYDLYGNLVQYRYVVPGSREYETSLSHDNHIWYAVDFKINPTTGEITGAKGLSVWEDDGSVYDTPTDITFSNGNFVSPKTNKICYAEYDKATNKMIVNYDLVTSGIAYQKVVQDTSNNKISYTLGYNKDKEFVYFRATYSPTAGNDNIVEAWFTNGSGAATQTEIITLDTGVNSKTVYKVTYDPSTKKLTVNDVNAQKGKFTYVDPDSNDPGVFKYTDGGAEHFFDASGNLIQYSYSDSDITVSITFNSSYVGPWNDPTSTNPGYTFVPNPVSGYTEEQPYAVGVGSAVVYYVHKNNWGFWYDKTDTDFWLYHNNGITYLETKKEHTDWDSNYFTQSTPFNSVDTSAYTLTASKEYTVPAAAPAASGNVALDLTPNGAAMITDYAHSPTETHTITAARAASGAVALDLTANGSTQTDYAHAPTYVSSPKNTESPEEVIIPLPTPGYSYRLDRPEPTLEHVLVPPEPTRRYKLAKLTNIPEYAAAIRNVYYQYGVVEDPIYGYDQVEFRPDEEHSTVTIRNRYKLFSITLDKYEKGKRDTKKLQGAEFVLYRYAGSGETGSYGMVLDKEAQAGLTDGLPAVGTGERMMVATEDLSRFTLTADGDSYLFGITYTNIGGQTVTKYLGENKLGLLSMMKDGGDNTDRVRWTLEDQGNGIWYLKKETDKYLVVKDGAFQLASGGVSDRQKEIKLWVLNPDGYATRGLTTDTVTGQQVILYNTVEDKALKISTGGISGLSEVESVQPTFKIGVYAEDAPRLTVAASNGHYTLRNEAGKYLAIENDVLVYSNTPYEWDLDFDSVVGKWTVKSADDPTVALKYVENVPGNPSATDQIFIAADYQNDDAFRFLLFGGTTKPLTPLTVAPNAGDQIAIYHDDDHVKLYYQRDAAQNKTEWTPNKSQATVLTTDDQGSAQFVGLNDDTYYYVEELNPPQDYEKLKDPIEVHVNSTDQEVNAPDTVTDDDYPIAWATWVDRNVLVGIPNEQQNLKIVVDKFQAGDRSQKLAGAKFILYRYPTQEELTAWTTMSDSDKQAKFGTTGDLTATTKLYYVKENDTDDVTYTVDPAQATEKETDENGYAEFTDLEEGQYYLKETVAPVDFRLLNEIVPIRLVGASGKTGANTGTDFVLVTDPDDSTAVAHVPNIPDSTLPATGGQGAAWIQGAAIALLTLGGAYLLYNALRKRREQDPDHPAA